MNKDLLIIRKVKPEDAIEWYAFGNRVWKDAYKHIIPEEVFVYMEKRSEEKIKQFSDQMKNDNENIAYVAEYDGKIIGTMSGCIKSAYEHFHEDYADLISLYVDPEFQGCGIGGKFRKIFEDWAMENGATKYVIGVLKDNDKARKVYEAWGGKLSEYEKDFMRLNVGYPEVFYTYDLPNLIKKSR